jgi:RimJ/RimL family protein N-acetyltransferase
MTGGQFLETERLTLRWLTLDDAALLLDVWNDPAFIRHVGDRGIRTLEAAQDAMRAGVLQLYETYDYGPFRLGLRTDDTAIGICGLFRRDGLDEPDLGYSTLPDYCGRGFAFEAAQTVIDYAGSGLGLERLIAIISPDNAASIGLIRKLGFEFERMHTLPGADKEVGIYGKSLIKKG